MSSPSPAHLDNPCQGHKLLASTSTRAPNSHESEQKTNAKQASPRLVPVLCRTSGRDLKELNEFCQSLVQRINDKYSAGTYTPVVWLDRPVPLYERVALYSVADCALVTCVRDGMNLVPYEYTVCRQGVQVR